MPRPVGMRSVDMPRKAAATLMKSHARTTHPGLPNAKLMARVGEGFPLECQGCGGDIRLIAFITEPGPIRKILTHLSEPLEPPPVSPARGPPTNWGELVQVHNDRDTIHQSPDFTAHDRHPLALRAATSLAFTWSIAHRGFDACGSAVDRAILAEAFDCGDST